MERFLDCRKTLRGARANNGSVMASIDIQERDAPKKDGLGLSLFALHLGVGGFVLTGWLLTSFEALTFYLVLLPVMAAQWALNRRSCLINNLESWLRTGRWRDPCSREEGRFLEMLCDRMFAMRPGPIAVDRLSYATVILLWLLALGHLSELMLA